MSPAYAPDSAPAGLGSLASDIRVSGREAQQLAVFVALSKVKREIRTLFEAHPTLRDLLPTRVVREEHIATDEYVGALERVRARIVVLRRNSRDLEREAGELIEQAEACRDSSEKKRTYKEEAVAFLKKSAPDIFTEHFSRARRAVRTTHVASEILYGALVAVDGSGLSGTVKADARALVRTIAPLRAKTSLKGKINTFLAKAELGDLRVRKTVRADHAPLVELIGRLRSVKSDLAAFQPARDAAADTMTRLDQLVAALGERKNGKRRRDELVAKIRKIEEDIPKIKAGVAGFERHLEGERSRQLGLRAAAARELAVLEGKLEGAQAARDRAQAGVEDLLAAIEQLDDFRAPDAWALEDKSANRDDSVSWLQGLRAKVPASAEAAELPPVVQLQILDAAITAARASRTPAVESPVQDWVDAALAGLETDRKGELGRARKSLEEADALITELRAQEDAFCAKLDAADQALDEITTLVDFCAKQKEEIKRAKEECQTFWQNYQNTQALVFYFGLNDNIQDSLLALGRFVKGYNDRVDALGRIEVVLVFDAGVRVGGDIGFVSLSASVQLTLILSGALEVLDSRQMSFEYRLALYVTAGAKASLGLSAPETGLDADIQKPPQVLIELAAQCRCNLWDCTGWTVYGSERTWAAHWSHAIARRIAFLRSVQVKDKGRDAISEEWVDAQVERLLGEREATGADGSAPVSWRKMLAERKALLAELAATPPRVYTMVRSDRIDAEVRVAVAGRSAGLGEKSRHRAEYAFSETRAGREHPLGSLAEDACTFEFAGKKGAKDGDESGKEKAPEARTVTNLAAAGHCVYHEWTPSEGRVAAPRGHDPGPRRYLEVLVSDAQRIGKVETWSFEMAGTISETLKNPRELRALAAALEHTPPDPESPRIDLPGRLTGDEDELALLAGASQQRAELVMSQGELAPLKRRLLAFEERRKKADKHVASLHKGAKATEESAGKIPGLSGDVAAWLGGEAAQARAVLDVAKGHLDAIGSETKAWLKNTGAVSLRWTTSWRCHLGEGGALSWKRVWVPQVYRGLQVRDFKVAVTQTVPIVPCVSAFFGFELRVRRRNAAFEVLGLGTFSYLKSLWHGLGQPGVGARADAETPWEQLVALHRQELHDLCEQVAQAGSSAFSEVVIDALYLKRTEARAFGRACWELFNPDHKNPFEALTEDAVVEALQGVPKPGAKRPAIALRLSALPTIPGPIAVPAVPVSMIEAGRINPEYLGRVEALLRGDVRTQVSEAFTTSRVALERVVVLKQLASKISGEHTPSPFELRSEREVEGVARLGKALDQARAHQTSVEADLASLQSKSDDLVARAGGLHGLLLREASAFEALDGALRALADGIGLPPAGALAGALPPLRNGEIPAKLLDDVVVAAEAAAHVRLVPSLGTWQVQSRVSWVIRSGATKKLDTELQQYDAALGRLSSPAARDGAAVPVGEQLERLALALQVRAAETRKLLGAIEAWRGGKDENDSNRAPRVGWFLEVPTQRQLITQQLCLAQLRLRRHIVACLRLADELGSALQAHEARMGGERDRRAQIEADEAKRRRLEAERKDALVVRTGQIATFMRERAVRTRQVVDQAKHRLLAKIRFPEAQLALYLKEGAEDFAVDALLHGQKKR